MEKSDNINELAQALSTAQAQMKPASFNATNPFLKNKYADLGSVIETSKAALKDNGLAVSQLVGGEGGAISVTTILMHKSGQWISNAVSLPTLEERGKSAAQVAGSIITYLRRYSLASILGIYADEDNDGQEKTHGETKAAPAHSVAPANVVQPATAPVDSEPVTASDGRSYDTMDMKELAPRFNELNAKLKANNMTDDERATTKAKLLAVQSAIDKIRGIKK